MAQDDGEECFNFNDFEERFGGSTSGHKAPPTEIEAAAKLTAHEPPRERETSCEEDITFAAHRAGAPYPSDW